MVLSNNVHKSECLCIVFRAVLGSNKLTFENKSLTYIFVLFFILVYVIVIAMFCYIILLDTRDIDRLWMELSGSQSKFFSPAL